MDGQSLAAIRGGLRVLTLTTSSLTRTVGFHALHRLYRPEWSEARNREVFGSVSEAPGHGHNYQCSVTVRGELDATGMIVDLALLDRVLQEEVLDPFANKHFNLDVPAFAYGKTLPTCEAIAAYVFRRLAGRLPPDVVLERVRITEDPSLYGDCSALE